MAFKRADPNNNVTWLPLPTGMWEMQVKSAQFVPSTKQDWDDQVKWVYELLPAEKTRLEEEREEPLPDDHVQSWVVTSYCGATLQGYRNGTYSPTRLAEAIAALFGRRNTQAVYGWIRNGGGPLSDDLDHLKWFLEWFHELQLDVLIDHKPGKDGRVFAFVKAVQARSDKEYSAFGRNKLQGMLTELGQLELLEESAPKPAAAAPVKPVAKPAAPAPAAPARPKAAGTAVATPPRSTRTLADFGIDEDEDDAPF